MRTPLNMVPDTVCGFSCGKIGRLRGPITPKWQDPEQKVTKEKSPPGMASTGENESNRPKNVSPEL